MKKQIVILVLLSVSLSTFAQMDLNITFGKKYGWVQPDNVNRTVYTYNYTRQWLDQKMDYFDMMNGWEFSTQARGNEGVGVEFLASHLGQINIAHGLEPSGGLTGYRKIKLGFGGLSFGATGALMQKKHMEIVAALDLDFHYYRIITTYSNDETFAGATNYLVVQKFKFANTFALNWSLFATNWIGINIRPYYQLPWGKVNVEGLMNELQSDNNPQRERLKNYGISVSLDLAFGRDN